MSAHIAQQILDRITSGILQAGDRLPSEVDLARDFEVSRPSIREALAALQFSGHVESRRGFGTVVTDRSITPGVPPVPDRPLTSLSQAVDLLETRLVLEPHAMASAATDPDRVALTTASRLIEGMRVAVEEPGLHASTDIAVHRALLAVCRNSILRESAIELLDLALDPMLLTARTKAWASPTLPRAWVDQHAVVCEAIAAGDAHGARVASLSHLSSVVDNLAAAAMHEPALERRIVAVMAHVGLSQHAATSRVVGTHAPPPKETEASHDRSW